MDRSGLYERDFVLWTEQQAAAIRSASASGTNLPLDWDHLAEEIESLGRSLRRELRSRLATIIEHLFKLELSVATEPRRGWVETVQRERLEVETLLDENPSLRSALVDDIAAADRKRRLVEASFVRFGEWSPARQEELSGVWFQESEILNLQFAE